MAPGATANLSRKIDLTEKWNTASMLRSAQTHAQLNSGDYCLIRKTAITTK